MIIEPKEKYPIILKDGAQIDVNANNDDVAVDKNILPIMAAYYIVHEDVFAQLPDPVDIDKHIAWHAKKVDQDALIAAGEGFMKAEMYAVNAIDYSIDKVTKILSHIVFVGLVIG